MKAAATTKSTTPDVTRAAAQRENFGPPLDQLCLVASARGLCLAGLLALSMLFVDRPLAEHFWGDTDSIHHLAVYVTQFGEAGWFLVPSLILYLIARLVRREPTTAVRMLFVFLSVAVAGILSDILKFLLGRARPLMLFSHGIYGFSPLQFSANYQSFPSGHTACAVAAGVAFAVLLPRYRAMFIAAGLLIALTRVIVASHYLSDVVAGAALAWLVVHALKRAFRHRGLAIGSALAAGAAPGLSRLAARLVGTARS